MAVAFAGSATSASAEVAETRDDGFTTRASAGIAATPLDVWLALTKPGLWWNDSHTWSGDASNMTLTPQAGGCFCEKLPGDDSATGFAMDGSVTHAIVLQASPLKVLRMRGGLGPLQSEPATGVLTITMQEVEGGTRVFWEYNVGGPMRYEIDMISKAVDGVMNQQLAGLQTHLGALEGEGSEPEPEPEAEEDTAAEPDGLADPADDGDDAPKIEAEPTLEEQIDALRGDD